MQASSSDVPSFDSTAEQLRPQSRRLSPKRKKSPRTLRVSLILPAWNEQASIRKAMREADRALSALAARLRDPGCR